MADEGGRPVLYQCIVFELQRYYDTQNAYGHVDRFVYVPKWLIVLSGVISVQSQRIVTRAYNAKTH